MSYIFFHSPSETVEVRGSERAYMGGFCHQLFMASLPLSEWLYSRSPMRNVLPPTSYVRNVPSGAFEQAFSNWSMVGDDHFVIGNREIPVFTTVLNTALVVGSDPVKLMARLHGQCELHAWVAGFNREWLAGIIEQGRSSLIFRDNAGWESVIDLLRLRDDEPVVTSYSVSEQFPGPHIATWQPPVDDTGELNYDAWYDLSDKAQWEHSMNALWQAQGYRELTPETWEVMRFGTGETGFDVGKVAREMGTP